MKKSNWIGVILSLSLPAIAVAAVTLPYKFQANDVISSAEMNENFTALASEIEALQDEVKELKASDPSDRLTALEGKVDILQGQQIAPYMASADSDATALIQGNTYIYPLQMTAQMDGKCQVTATLMNPNSGENTSGTVTVHTAMKTGDNEVYDNLAGPLLDFNEKNETQTVAHVYPVVAGTEYEFGCQAFTSQSSDPVGDLVRCRASVVCY